MRSQFDERLRFATAIAALAFGLGFTGFQGDVYGEESPVRSAAPQPAKNANGEEKPALPAVGLWELEYEYQGTAVVDRYEIKADSSGSLTGKLLRNDKEVTKLDKVRFEDGKLSFEATGTTDGVEWKAELSGRIEGDAIEGTVKIKVNDQTFDLPWNPKRVKKDK